jgi:hypothetical protein
MEDDMPVQENNDASLPQIRLPAPVSQNESDRDLPFSSIHDLADNIPHARLQ